MKNFAEDGQKSELPSIEASEKKEDDSAGYGKMGMKSDLKQAMMHLKIEHSDTCD